MHENTPIEEIINMASSVGVHYDSYWGQMCAQVNAIQQLAPWRQEDFLYRIVGSKVFDASGAERPELNVKAIQAADVTWHQGHLWDYDRWCRKMCSVIYRSNMVQKLLLDAFGCRTVNTCDN